MHQVFRRKCSVDKASAAYFTNAGTNAGIRSIPYTCLPTPGLLIVPNDARCFISKRLPQTCIDRLKSIDFHTLRIVYSFVLRASLDRELIVVNIDSVKK